MKDTKHIQLCKVVQLAIVNHYNNDKVAIKKCFKSIGLPSNWLDCTKGEYDLTLKQVVQIEQHIKKTILKWVDDL